MRHSGSGSRRDDHRADPGVGEQLEQQHVRPTPVDQVHRSDPAADGAGAARHLGDHAPGDGAVVDEPGDLVGVDPGDERRRVLGIGEQTGDIGEEDELLRAQLLGGYIVSSKDCSDEELEQAKAEGRFYSSYGNREYVFRE